MSTKVCCRQNVTGAENQPDTLRPEGNRKLEINDKNSKVSMFQEIHFIFLGLHLYLVLLLMRKKHESTGVFLGVGGSGIYTHGTQSFSLGLCCGDTIRKIITCTCLDVTGFLSKEPPTGENTGSAIRAALSELITSAAKGGGN